MPLPNSIDAPYNFVPLADKVVTPEWASRVSHDLPFKDGLSGEIAYTLTAHSPLLVGGRQRAANESQPGEAWPFQTPDSRYAIPGSSMRGMVRAVLEIATFSRMALVDDKRYGLRDISGRHVAESYTSRVRGRVQPGFLRLGEGGNPEVVPCDMARFSHRDLEKWWGQPAPVFSKRTSVARKYERWISLCSARGITDPFNIKVLVSGDTVTSIGTGIDGFPVLTGQISDNSDDKTDPRTGKLTRGKYRDFVFYGIRVADAFSLREADPAAWKDFLFIHGDEDDKPDMPWPGFWKRRFWQRKDVPVFFIRSAHRVQLGLAYMPKLPGDFSVRDMVRHTSVDHCDQAKADLATLLFGQEGDKPEHTLKGRIWFDLAKTMGDIQQERQPVAILSSPKPSYFPNYLQQPASKETDWKLRGKQAQYATYLETTAHPMPELRGWKRYPARPEKSTQVQQPFGPDQEKKKKIQIRLWTLPAGAAFDGRIVFHNLRPEELGAVLWSLDFGGAKNCRHSLGLGKPFGFGQVELAIREDASRIIPNDRKATTPDFESCRSSFEQYMTERLKVPLVDTPQIVALRAIADPQFAANLPGQLKHMVLARIPDPEKPGKKRNINEFRDAKQAGLALASCVSLPNKVQRPAGRDASTRSGLLELPESVWVSVGLKFEKGKKEVSASNGPHHAFVTGDEALFLLDSLDSVARRKLESGKLRASITVQHLGGKNWKITAITS